ncbi:hypothetical protein ABTE68_20185, partial [Acinetobacter baumannii]
LWQCFTFPACLVATGMNVMSGQKQKFQLPITTSSISIIQKPVPHFAHVPVVQLQHFILLSLRHR